MGSIIRTRTIGRLGVVVAAAAPLLAAAVPAWAQVPSNTNINNATVITSLPFNDVLDISEATFTPPDQSSCFGESNAVWYQFTPTSNESVALDPSRSNALMAVDVFTGTPTALTFVGCGVGGPDEPFGYILNATAGTTYWIMASAVCCGQAPPIDLNLWAYLAAPPQVTLSVTSGTIDRAGNAIITGTLNCTGTDPDGMTITGTLTQPVGRLRSVSGSFTTTAPCAPAQSWTALAQPTTGKFAGAAATANIPSFYLCNIAGCTTPSDISVIKLHG